MKKLLLLMLLMLPTVLGAGLGPAQRIFLFEDGVEMHSFFYVNPETLPATIELEVSGAAAPFIELEQTSYRIHQAFTPIPYTVRIPGDTTKKPYTGNIEVLFIEEVQGQVNARVTLNHLVRIETEVPQNLVYQRYTPDTPPAASLTESLIDLGSEPVLIALLVLLIIASFVLLLINFYISRPKEHLEDLRRYVQRERARGVPDNLIRAELEQAGWSKFSIREVMKK